MAGLPFTHLKEETDLAILAVLRACRLYVCRLVRLWLLSLRLTG